MLDCSQRLIKPSLCINIVTYFASLLVLPKDFLETSSSSWFFSADLNSLQDESSSLTLTSFSATIHESKTGNVIKTIYSKY